MPGQFFSNAERERLQRFPSEVAPADLIAFFTLSESDLAQVPVTAASHNQLGFALQLCALRYLGFAPDDLSQAPADVVKHVAGQLGVSSEGLSLYGKRPHTRTDHLQAIIGYLGFRKATPADLEVLDKWLMERALELKSAVDRRNQITRPLNDHYFDFFATRYGYLRQFTPTFLDAFGFRSHLQTDPLLKALELIRSLNGNGQRSLPDDAPMDFVPPKWQPFPPGARPRA